MQMPEAPVLLTGQVLFVKPRDDFKSKQPDGASVGILAGDGATEVRLSQDQLQTYAPAVGSVVAWQVRHNYWTINDDRTGEVRSGLTVRLIDALQASTLNYLKSVLEQSAKQPEPVKS